MSHIDRARGANATNDSAVTRPVQVSTLRSNTSSTLTQQQQQQQQQLEHLINKTLANDSSIQFEETLNSINMTVVSDLRMLLKEIDDTNWMFVMEK